MSPISKHFGAVASLHLHPTNAGEPFSIVSSIEVEAGRGIVGNPRYHGRINRSGEPNRRQVSMIEREQIESHARALGLPSIAPGLARSNIETSGVNLIELIGQRVRIGGAILAIYEARLPCAKMDAICRGLRERMQDQRQGVLAEVIQSGPIKVGDALCPLPS